MQVEQYVMAYEVEQDRLRALLPGGICLPAACAADQR